MSAMAATKTYFTRTLWDMVDRAKRNETSAVSAFIKRYRAPVRSFIRKQGIRRAEADDLAQDVFLTIIRGGVLRKVEKSRGRFRSFLLGVTKNVIRNARRKAGAARRGGGVAVLPLEFDVGVEGEDDDTFDRAWILHLVDLGLQRLKKECEEKDLLYYCVLKRKADDEGTHEEIARDLGKSVMDVKNYLRRGRAKLTRYIEEEIGEYTTSFKEYEHEIRYLTKLMGPLG